MNRSICRVVKHEMHEWCLFLVRYLPGKVGVLFRRLLYSRMFKNRPENLYVERDVSFSETQNSYCGDNVYLCQGCQLHGNNGGTIKIGNNSYIGTYSCIHAYHGIIDIGNDVLIAGHVYIHSANHQFADISTPIRCQGNVPETVHIDDDVWIGANATILPGVRIGKGAVVGGGAVVTKDVMPYTVVAGVPARIIRVRGEGRDNTNINIQQK